MKMVIDSNCLQDPELRLFLTRSVSNIAVLTDYAAMEAYRGANLAAILRTMEIVSAFPNQVLCLKGTRVCGMARGRNAGLQRRLIDKEQTQNIQDYWRLLLQAQAGDRGVLAALKDHTDAATDQLARMLNDAETTGEALAGMADLYTKQERAIIRSGEAYTAEMRAKFIDHLLIMADFLFANHPDGPKRPSFEELPNTFLFRSSLCMLLLTLDWAANGGAAGADPARLRNDIVDINFATFSTYFDGLMSKDRKAQRIAGNARGWLRDVFHIDIELAR